MTVLILRLLPLVAFIVSGLWCLREPLREEPWITLCLSGVTLFSLSHRSSGGNRTPQSKDAAPAAPQVSELHVANSRQIEDDAESERMLDTANPSRDSEATRVEEKLLSEFGRDSEESTPTRKLQSPATMGEEIFIQSVRHVLEQVGGETWPARKLGLFRRRPGYEVRRVDGSDNDFHWQLLDTRSTRWHSETVPVYNPCEYLLHEETEEVSWATIRGYEIKFTDGAFLLNPGANIVEANLDTLEGSIREHVKNQEDQEFLYREEPPEDVHTYDSNYSCADDDFM